MSRTIRKYIRKGYCYGVNTDYYRLRNREDRRKNNNYLRNIISKNDYDYVYDNYLRIIIPYDDWNEPTDGSYIIKNKKYKKGIF